MKEERVKRIFKGTGKMLILTLLITSFLPLGLFQIANAAEPGNNFDSALEVTAGRYSRTLRTGEHFFKIELQKGQTLTLRLNVPEGSEYDLFLYDPDKNLLASSELPRSLDESIRHKVEATGFYFIKIKGIRLLDSGVYELTILNTDFKVVNADWGTLQIKPEAGPGDVGIPLQVTVRNGVNNAVEDIVATLKVSNFFSNSTGGNTVTTYLSDPILSGKTGIFIFTLNIDDDATIGRHNFILNLNYKVRIGSDLIEGSPEDLTVTVFLLGKVNLAVSTETVSLTPDKMNIINIQFKNIGTASASALEVILTTPQSIILAGAENRLYFDKIRPGEIADTSIPVHVSATAADTLVQLALSMTYTDAYGNLRSTSRSLGFRVEAEAERVLFKVAKSFWSVAGSPLEVGPGDDGVTLNVQVQNLGEDVVTGLHGTLYLKPPFSKELEENMVFSSYGAAVQPGQVGIFEFVFDVDDDAAVGRYLLNMELSYLLVKGGEYQKAEPISLEVPILLLGKVDIAVSPSVVVFRPGESNSLSISVTNLGSGEASAIDIGMTIPPNVSLNEVDNHITIQSLKAGASFQKEFSAFIPLNAAGSTIQFTFSVGYRDPYGTVRSIVRTLSFRVSDIEGAEVSIADTVWGSPGSPIEVNLGDRNVPVTVVVENIGTMAITGLQAELFLVPPFTSTSGSDTASAYFGGVIQPGETANLRFMVDLNDEGESGLYRFRVSVKYLIVKGQLYEAARQDDLTASLLLRDRVDLEVNIEGNILTAETVNDVTITVTNTGGIRVEDLTVTVTPPGTISLTSGSSRLSFRSIQPGESREINLRFFAPATTVGLPLQGQVALTYKDGYGISHSESQAFGLIVKAWSSPLTISTAENILEVGRVSEPEIEIENVGRAPVYSLKVILTLPAAQAGSSPVTLISGSNQWFFNQVEGRSSVSFRPQILSVFTAADNSYQATLSISFQDDHGVSHSETRSISFTARGVAEMMILETNTSPVRVPPNSTATISGTILNKGTASALYTRVKAKPSEYISPDSREGVYLGEITPNAPFAFSITVAVSNGAPTGEHPVTLLFTYENDYGKRYTFDGEAIIHIGEVVTTTTERTFESEGLPSIMLLLIDLVFENWIYTTLGLALILLLIMVARRRRVENRLKKRIAAAEEPET